MNIALLLIGGNMGDRLENLKAAREAIGRECGCLLDRSAVYETAAWGLEEQPPFLNQALKIETVLEPVPLLQGLLRIEASLGRIREKKYGPRLIDIDILLYNQAVISREGLTVPHPELPNRRFALQCLHDIGPGEVHPLLRKTIRKLLQDCTDPLEVHKFN